MGTSEKVYATLSEKAPGMTTAEIAARVKPPGVKDINVATRSALNRLRNADRVRGERCADGHFRWRRA